MSSESTDCLLSPHNQPNSSQKEGFWLDPVLPREIDGKPPSQAKIGEKTVGLEPVS